ncbi:MAG TPA: hypothetical protein PLL26_03320 [Candidatus Dojkabacteria bacterium]|nr:hypothetical protein [Candidatus Dojkabacteria bacterium]
MTTPQTILAFITGALLFIGICVTKNILTSKICEKKGDFTPKSLGFNDANPIKHIDILGLLLYITSGIGWEKKIEMNRTQLSRRGLDLILIFIFRQLFHLVLIIFSLIILELMSIPPVINTHSSVIYNFFFQAILSFIATNGIMVIFAFVPFAPFDMFYLIRDLIPGKIAFLLDSAEQYTPWIIALILSPYSPIFPIIEATRTGITEIAIKLLI